MQPLLLCERLEDDRSDIFVAQVAHRLMTLAKFSIVRFAE